VAEFGGSRQRGVFEQIHDQRLAGLDGDDDHAVVVVSMQHVTGGQFRPVDDDTQIRARVRSHPEVGLLAGARVDGDAFERPAGFVAVGGRRERFVLVYVAVDGVYPEHGQYFRRSGAGTPSSD